QTAERLQAEHHVTVVVPRVIKRLADFEMAFAAAGERVVERRRQTGQLVLRRQAMREAAKRGGDAVVLPRPDALACREQQAPRVIPDVARGMAQRMAPACR